MPEKMSMSYHVLNPKPVLCLTGMAASLLFGAPVWSAEWAPTKPVRVIVSFPPGGATDLVARMIQPKMSAGLGRQVIIDNRPGANGVISNELIARADPDGHTIGFCQSSGNRTSKWSNDSQSEPFTNVQRTRHGRHR